jgi:hypothetical protein
MGMHCRNGLAIILLVFTTSYAVAADVHRWTDEHGKVHFGDRPPAAGTETETVGTTGEASSQQDGDAAATRERQAHYLEGLRRERAQKEEAEARAAAERKVRAQNCRVARGRLDTYRRASGIFTYNNKGERQYYDKKKREAAIRRAQKQVNYWCK